MSLSTLNNSLHTKSINTFPNKFCPVALRGGILSFCCPVHLRLRSNSYSGTEGDESTTDTDVNETEDFVYEELDNLPNEDAGRVPKGIDYILEEGHLCVPVELNGTITATATIYSDLPDQALEFKYDVNGLRVQKKLTKADKSTVTTDYILHGDQVNHVTVTEATAGGTVTATSNLHFYYDASNRPIALDFNGEKYFYAHNVHNDIAAILDSNGTTVVEYKYNAWGKLLATIGTLAATPGKLNPFRYRGYMYDEETRLYYVSNMYPAVITILKLFGG